MQQQRLAALASSSDTADWLRRRHASGSGAGVGGGATKQQQQLKTKRVDFFAEDGAAVATTTTTTSGDHRRYNDDDDDDEEEQRLDRGRLKKVCLGADNRQAIADMLTHVRRLHISASPIHATYIYQPELTSARTVRFNGLTRLLRQCCYPDYDFERARKLAGPIPKALRAATGLSRPWHGRERGRLGHQQIQVAVNVGADAVAALFVGSGRLSEADDFMRSLRHKHLRPITAEFIDYYEGFGVATATDVLCVTDDENRHGAGLLSLLEVKFGGDNNFLDSTGPLRAPASLASKYNNSPAVQARLQLAFCRQMFVDHYPGVRLGPCYVVQVAHAHSNYGDALEQQFIDAGPEIRDLVLLAAAERAEQRRRRRRRRSNTQ